VYIRPSPFEDTTQPSERWFIDGDDVEVICRTDGRPVHDDDSGASSDQWVQVSGVEGPAYIADLYVGTTRDPSVPRC
jgi:hypothetical protein